MTDITSIGEILIDLTQTGSSNQGVPVFAAYPGGAPANVAVAASRLGARTAFIGKVGRDAFGEYLKNTLERNGVSGSGLIVGGGRTTLALVAVTSAGERSFQFHRGADRTLTEKEVPVKLLRETKILHFGSVSLTEEPARGATLYAARQARQLGALVSYDPNYRPDLWPNEEEAREWMARPLPLVDVLKLSEEELPLLTGGERDLKAGSAMLEEQGVRLVLVTLGAKGVFYRWRDGTGRVPGEAVEVVDTNGAGDTFFGAVLSRLARREAKSPLDGLAAAELEEILAFGNRAAAITCSRSGAIPAMPTLAEI